MNTLTPEKVLQLVAQHECHIYPEPTSPFYGITLKRITDLLNAVFALGIEQGVHQERGAFEASLAKRHEAPRPIRSEVKP
jgi:hypothetical protein